MTIDRQLICNAGEVPSLAPPKTPASVRTVPLPDVVGEVLAQHIAAYNVEPGALLFTMDDGRQCAERPEVTSSVQRPTP